MLAEVDVMVNILLLTILIGDKNERSKRWTNGTLKTFLKK